jgi:phage baseplate assembly protein W
MTTALAPASTRPPARPAPAPGDYLGRALAFPLLPTAGRLGIAVGPDAVAQSIVAILDTEPGERVMRPDFGCGLRAFLMEPNSVATRARIQREVANALAIWEPRIVIESVEVIPAEDPAQILIGIAYVHVRDRRPGSVVYELALR